MTGLRTAAVTLAIMAAAAAGPAAALPGGASAESWWIELADRPEVAGKAWDDPVFDERMRRCGLDPFTTQSAAFIGAEPGRILVVHLRAYPTEAAAKRDLAAARRCSPGATVRRGRLVLE